jgi:general secretion pathway protein B
MSYILDALERSEQERNEAELPSFRQDKAMLFVKKQRRTSWPVWAALLLFNLVALGGIFYLVQTPETPASAEDELAGAGAVDRAPAMASSRETEKSVSSQAATISQAAVRQATVPQATVPQETDSSATAANRTPINQVDDPVPMLPLQAPSPAAANIPVDSSVDTVQGQLRKTERAIQTGEVAEITGNVEMIEPSLVEGELIRPKGYKDPSYLTTSYASPSAQNAQAQQVPVSETIVTPNGGRVAVASVPFASESAVQEQFVEVDESEQFRSLPYLQELSVSERPRVPKLIFNSHIYSSDPSARRVMMNNIYLREGQQFSGMELEYIGEEFIVLNKQGERFRLPVMRDWLN